MKYNILGKTDMKVSHVSMGGASFSNIYGDLDEEKSLQLIKKTLSLGVNYLETGPWYGQGTSEIIIGKAGALTHGKDTVAKKYGACLVVTGPRNIWMLLDADYTISAHPQAYWRSFIDSYLALKEIPRETYFIGSKVGRYEKDIKKMFDFSTEKTEVAVDNTLELLGLDYVDLIQMHDVTFAPDFSIILKETLPTLERAVKDGKARYIGIADYDLELMKEIIEESDIRISTMLSYSKSTLFDNRLQNYTKYFKSKGVGVINAAATGMGLLTNSGPQPWHPASDDVKTICKQASDYCKGQGVELARLATWFTLNQPDVDTNVCGFFNIQQMEDTLSVFDEGLSDQEKAVLAHLQLRFFDNVTLHWDEVELIAYKRKLENIAS